MYVHCSKAIQDFQELLPSKLSDENWQMFLSSSNSMIFILSSRHLYPQQEFKYELFLKIGSPSVHFNFKPFLKNSVFQ